MKEDKRTFRLLELLLLSEKFSSKNVLYLFSFLSKEWIAACGECGGQCTIRQLNPALGDQTLMEHIYIEMEIRLLPRHNHVTLTFTCW